MTPEELLLLIISSPSGAGKTTLTRRLLQQFPLLDFSVSHTTRKRRAQEVDGRDYHFVDRTTFEARIAGGDFAEWAEVHGNLYGTSLSELDRARKNKRSGIVFDVDYQGARQIRSSFPWAVGIFILPPSMEELERRLRGRASEDEDAIRRRFEKAKIEIEHYPFFDYVIVNDELDRAAAQLCGVVHAEGCRRQRMAKHAERLLR
ncbi:MAG: guanylate kinase [Myxococcota bacterium]